MCKFLMVLELKNQNVLCIIIISHILALGKQDQSVDQVVVKLVMVP